MRFWAFSTLPLVQQLINHSHVKVLSQPGFLNLSSTSLLSLLSLARWAFPLPVSWAFFLSGFSFRYVACVCPPHWLKCLGIFSPPLQSPPVGSSWNWPLVCHVAFLFFAHRIVLVIPFKFILEFFINETKDSKTFQDNLSQDCPEVNLI